MANPAYVRRAPLLDGVDEFDAEFFGFTPQAARMTDPQHRLFLQCAYHALEDAGCDPAQFDGSIGVYGASSASGYLAYNLMSHHNLSTIMGQGMNMELIGLTFQNDKDFLATRALACIEPARARSLSVQTACSSSLVALHLACQSLLNGECDMALAGGASLRIPHNVGLLVRNRGRSCRRPAIAAPSMSAPTARFSAVGSRWWRSSRCTRRSMTGTASTPSSADRPSTTTAP